MTLKTHNKLLFRWATETVYRLLRSASATLKQGMTRKSMFWFKTIYKWWSYSWPLLIIISLVDWFFISAAAGSGGSVVDFAASVTHEQEFYNKSRALVFAFMILGPFINLWVWLKLATFLKEAVEDVSIQNKTAVLNAQKNKAIAILCALIGIVLVPIFLWLYTSNVLFLWEPETSFWQQAGYWLGAVIAIFLAFGGPRLFPKQTKKILSLVAAIEDKIAT